MSKLTKAEFRLAYPDATITQWVLYWGFRRLPPSTAKYGIYYKDAENITNRTQCIAIVRAFTGLALSPATTLCNAVYGSEAQAFRGKRVVGEGTTDKDHVIYTDFDTEEAANTYLASKLSDAQKAYVEVKVVA